jgi:uncharacterized Zn finger protein (UPF0148 family)
MKRSHRSENEETGVELKYCEHCGGLFVRERGGGVYCGKCREKVAELPIPKKRPGRLTLPVGAQSIAERYKRKASDRDDDMEAMGGVA